MTYRWPETPEPREKNTRPRALTSSVVKTSISSFDVVRAYVYEDAGTQEHIEEHGRSNAAFLRSLISDR